MSQAPEQSPRVIAAQSIDGVNLIDGKVTVAVSVTTADGRPFALLMHNHLATRLQDELGALMLPSDENGIWPEQVERR